MEQLDTRIDNQDARISIDTDLLCQFLFEFFFGGIFIAESGILRNFLSFGFAVLKAHGKVLKATKESYLADMSAIVPITYSLLSLIPYSMLAGSVSTELKNLQKYESSLRLAFTRVRLKSESIAFYSGEGTEEEQIMIRGGSLWGAYQRYGWAKFKLDLFLQWMNVGKDMLGILVAGPVIHFGAKESGKEPDRGSYSTLDMCVRQQASAILQVAMVSLDAIKAASYSRRVVGMLQALEEFQALAGEESERIPANVRKLEASKMIDAAEGPAVLMRNCNIYTPDGQFLLMEGFSFDWKAGERWLIQGPSGIGKSSILRVVAKLWPLFESPSAMISGTQGAVFERPGPENLFFIAQKPYLVPGSLRLQVAYPVWSDSLLKVEDEVLHRLFLGVF